jgi:hypothetical protein
MEQYCTIHHGPKLFFNEKEGKYKNHAGEATAESVVEGLSFPPWKKAASYFDKNNTTHNSFIMCRNQMLPCLLTSTFQINMCGSTLRFAATFFYVSTLQWLGI